MPLRSGGRAAPAVSLRQVSARLGRRTVVDAIDLDLHEGVTVLAGPNGAGKTTLLRMLATLRRPSAGEMTVLGLPARRRSQLREIRRQTGYLAQDPRQHGHLKVAEAVDYAAWLKGLTGALREQHVADALELADLGSWAHRRMSDLSGGTRRRAHLAQALVHRPRVLLLDEPTTGVDAEHRVDLRELLRRVAAERIVVMSTHLTEDVELLADRVVVMDAGRVAFDGSPVQLSRLGAETHDATIAASARAVERGLRAVSARSIR